MKRESCTSQVHEGNVIKLDDINSKSKSTITLLPASQYEQLFEKFYDVYPRKRGKGAARLSFARATRRTPPNFILSKAHEFRAHCIEQATEIQFIPYPSVWLNQERWDDDLAAEAETKSAWGELANDL